MPRALHYILPVLLLAGCAGSPVVTGSYPAAPVGDMSFSVAGRIGVRHEQGAETAHFDWRHASVRDTVSLTTPLGQTVAQLERLPEQVTLTLADGRQFASRNVESLSRDVLGWELPLSGMQYWLRGVPVPGLTESSAVLPETAGRTINQSGWVIHYPDYAGPPAIPARIILQRQGLEIRVAVHQWDFEP